MPIEKLPCVLTEAERNARSREAGTLLARYDELEERKKLLTKEITDDMKQVRKEMTAAARAGRTGVEERDVETKVVPNVERLIMQTFREDTKEAVSQRPMTDDEIRAARQKALPLRDVSAAPASPIRGAKPG